MTTNSSESNVPFIDIIASSAVSGMATHQEKWDTLTGNDAAFARAAMRKANALYASDVNPGDAYLQCLADMAQFRSMIQMTREVLLDIRTINEMPEVSGSS